MSRRPPILSAQVVQKQLDLRRVQENTRLDIQKKYERDAALSSAAAGEGRVDVCDYMPDWSVCQNDTHFISMFLEQAKRKDRQHQQQMAELYQDLMIQQQEDEARKRKILSEQEDKLAAEMLRFVFVIYNSTST